MTAGSEEGGVTAMETLLQRCPDINVVYAINEPAAAGGYQALQAAGKDDGSVLIVAVDGGCPGVENVKSGVIGATSQQYPLLMASMALEASNSPPATLPAIDPAVGFLDTGATLITDKPVDGVELIDTAKGLELCWG